MKYTVIVSGVPYTIVAGNMDEEDGRLVFADSPEDADGRTTLTAVAEFKQSKVDGIIFEDNNVS